MKTTENIWNQYHKKLAAFIRQKVDEDVVDDLLQDVFIKIHTQIDSLKDSAKLESWLFQITRNAVIDHYRSKRTLGELPDWIEQPESEEEDVIKQELASCLEPMVNHLPDKYRNAIQMSEIENKTQKEVADSENISLSGAKSRIQRGRAMLRSILLDCCTIELNKNNQLLAYDKKNKEQDCR